MVGAVTVEKHAIIFKKFKDNGNNVKFIEIITDGAKLRIICTWKKD